MTEQEPVHTPRQEPSTEELEERLNESVKADGGDDPSFIKAFGPLAFFFLAVVSGALTAMVLVYGTIEPELTLNSVLMFPLVLLAMILTVPAWVMVFLAILKAVEDVLRGIHRVIFRD